MLDQTNANIERHIKTHTERSDDDRAAVSVLETFLRSNGRINTSFASDDKWPNHDNTFEFVPNPEISRRPVQTFYVQIKGTRNYTEREGVIKYTLKDLAFPAFICDRVSLDPGILFVILNPAERGNERVFWKYMSPNFLNSIDFAKGSMTVSFSPEEEILNDDESVLAFCERLEEIVERHSFVNQLERHSYSFEEAKRIVEACDEEITESIDNLSILNKNRDNISRRILTRLNDLCISALLLNAMKDGYQNPSAGFAWEYSLLRANTKYLGNFCRGLQYIGRRIPEEGQAERLMLKYYFQNANTETAVVWRDWKYKVGDHILFNDMDRFSLLYNNLKGRIVQIELFDSRIRFTVDVEIPLTEQDCQNDGIEFIDIIDDVTRIRFDVFDFEEEMADEDRKKTIVPFQLAYAVSIHKAQGLEYRSVKVVIPSSNAEKITHGIFYTAITRAKEKLKIYWSSETMQEVVAGFSIDTSRQKSLAIIKEKLKQDKNT